MIEVMIVAASFMYLVIKFLSIDPKFKGKRGERRVRRRLEKSIQAALKRKRKIIEESKLYTYNQLSELYGLDGQALLDAVTAEHDLIQKFTANGMTYDEISGLADDSKVGQQMTFSEHNSYSD